MLRRSRCLRAVADTFTKGQFTVSRLNNGLRVITCDDGSAVTGIAFFTSCAPHVENPEAGTAGSSAMLECLPLSGNRRHTAAEISTFFERTGNSFKVVNNKECIGYFAMAPRYHVKETLDVLTGMVLYPTDSDEIFSQAKQNVELSAELFKQDATRVAFEQLYTAGWGHHGVGVPQLPDAETVAKLTKESFLNFHRTYTRPETSVLAATGVTDHKAFVETVEEIVQFDCTEKQPEVVPAFYTGGGAMQSNLEAPDSTRKFAEKNLTHIAICMPTTSMLHKDFFTYSVIQTAMGGGTSFSSGGPGKGIHTKLFREVLNQEGWIHGIECISGWFRCGGLIGLYGQSPHDWNAHLFRCLLVQLASMSLRINDSQLEMAKNQLMSQLVMLGENREVMLEEMGRNLLLHDFVCTSKDLLEGTQAVTLEDLHRATREAILGKKAAVSVFGNTERLPTYDETNTMLQSLYTKLNKSSKL